MSAAGRRMLHITSSLLLLLACIASLGAPASATSQVQRLEPAALIANARFGNSIDGDGARVVIGSPGDAGLIGAAYIFNYTGGKWVEGDKLIPASASMAHFGTWVAISGSTIAVGAQAEAAFTGAVHVFAEGPGGWALDAQIAPPATPPVNRFGARLGLDGSVLAVYSEAGSQIESNVYVYRRGGAGWSLEATIEAGKLTSLSEISAVAVSNGRVFVGGYLPTSTEGAVAVFEYLAGAWAESFVAVPSQPPVGSPQIVNMARSLGASGDTIVAGTPTVAVVFRRAGNSWLQEAILDPPPVPGLTGFGGGMVVEGDTIAGAFDEPGCSVYVRKSASPFSVWTRVLTSHYLTTGYATGLALAHGHVLTGDPVDSTTVSNGGAVMAEKVLPPPTSYCTPKVNSLGCTPAVGADGIPSLSGPDTFSITATNVRNGKVGILIWSLAPNNSPFLGGTLCVAPPITRTSPQWAGGTPPPSNDCSGGYSFHWSQAYMASKGIGPGTVAHAQWWSRDQGFPAPNNVGLTDGLRFVVGP